MKKENLSTEKTNVNILDILAIGNNVLSTKMNGKKASIYKSEIFTNLNDKEKKKIRMKLRKKLSHFVDTFTIYKVQKNDDAINKLFNSFNEYVKNVYIDINKIFEDNTGEKKKSEIVNFQDAFNKYVNKEKK